MRKEDKQLLVEALVEDLKKYDTVYVTDIEALNAEVTSQLRRTCFKRDIQLKVVKNTLLRKAMELSGKDFSELYPVLKGNSAIFLSETGNAPAKLIQEFRKKNQKPVLKGAYVQEVCFLGDDNLNTLATLKSRTELIADIAAMLQSPARSVIGALQGQGQKIAGILKTLSEKAA